MPCSRHHHVCMLLLLLCWWWLWLGSWHHKKPLVRVWIKYKAAWLLTRGRTQVVRLKYGEIKQNTPYLPIERRLAVHDLRVKNETEDPRRRIFMKKDKPPAAAGTTTSNGCLSTTTRLFNLILQYLRNHIYNISPYFSLATESQPSQDHILLYCHKQ